MRETFRPFAFVLALTAMLLRGFLPAGWMPSADGGAPIVICTGQGLVHSSSPQHGLPQKPEQLCAFAAAAHLAPPFSATPALVPNSAGLFVTPQLPDTPSTSADSYRPQSPRAPPVLA